MVVVNHAELKVERNVDGRQVVSVLDTAGRVVFDGLIVEVKWSEDSNRVKTGTITLIHRD